jgi:hypothetical protein
MPRKAIKPCGTKAAARRHQRRGERPCEPCLEAQRGGPRQPARVARCGTPSGYNRHRRLREPACRPCLDANAEVTAHYQGKGAAA